MTGNGYLQIGFYLAALLLFAWPLGIYMASIYQGDIPLFIRWLRPVERGLYRLAGVSEVAVVGLPHPRWIEAVTAVVVAKPGADLTEAQVIAHCAAQLAHFKTPKGVVFVDSLPKNPSGKLLKRELRLRFEGHYGG